MPELTRQWFMKDNPAQHSREHEVCTCVDDADTDCTACQSESTCKQSPHNSVEGKVHGKEKLSRESQRCLLSILGSCGLQSDTYASHECFNNPTLFLHAEEVRPFFKLCGGGHFGEHAIEWCTCARWDGVEEPLGLRCCHFPSAVGCVCVQQRGCDSDKSRIGFSLAPKMVNINSSCNVTFNPTQTEFNDNKITWMGN